MAHTIRDKKKLLNRIGRIRGQLEAIRRALEEEHDCSEVLQRIAACRGAINGLMVVVLEGHVREHVQDPDKNPTSAQARATQELLDLIQAYLK